MTQASTTSSVDFYILDKSDREHTLQFACRLTEKAYSIGNRVLLRVDDTVEAKTLDNLLWTFKQESFVPHELMIGSAMNPSANNERVMINTADEPSINVDVLINLALSLPSQPTHWPRIVEIVSTNERIRQIAREHYNHYRTHHMPLRTHRIPTRNDQR